MKKKLVKFLVCLCLAAITMGGCGDDRETSSGREENDILGLESAATETGTADSGIIAEPEAEADPETEAELPLEYVEPAATDFEYNYDAVLGGVVITKYNGEAEAIRIPAEIDGEPVKGVGCKDNSSITHIELPDGITSIGEQAFAYCSYLTEITIPDSVTSIGDGAFFRCSRLTEITIPDNVTSIGAAAFAECRSLTEITIPDSVTSIGKRAFAECSSLMEITIPDNVTSFGGAVFAGCSSLTEITIPDSVTSLESIMITGIVTGAFQGCSSLTEITIPDSVTSIGGNAFKDCSSLRNITIPDNAKIEANAFEGCNGLTVTYQGQEYNYANDPNHWW